jgi:hypothetical protein
MDASFKQYEYTPGANIKDSMPFDVQKLLNHVEGNFTVNETEGWVQNFDYSSTLTNNFLDYSNNLTDYLNNSDQSTTVDDLLTKKKIITQDAPLLASSLPYQTLVVGSIFSQLPDSLRWKINLNLYETELDKVLQSPQLTVGLNLSEIGSKRLSASYIPASESDEQVIQNFVGANRLPIYLVHETLRIQLDDKVLAEHRPQAMGASQYWGYTLRRPGGSTIHENFKLVSSVGDEIVFGINSVGITSNQVSARYNSVNPNASLENLNHLAIGLCRCPFVVSSWFPSIY